MADESSSLGAAHLDDFWDLHRRLGERYELLLKELRRAKVDGCSALTNSHANSQTPSSRVQIPDDDLPLLDPAELLLQLPCDIAKCARALGRPVLKYLKGFRTILCLIA
eukprot:g837.t1